MIYMFSVGSKIVVDILIGKADKIILGTNIFMNCHRYSGGSVYSPPPSTSGITKG